MVNQLLHIIDFRIPKYCSKLGHKFSKCRQTFLVKTEETLRVVVQAGESGGRLAGPLH
jgi:hypothetical protein